MTKDTIKYSIGNRVAKELIRMIHGHEQRWADCLRDCWMEAGKGGKIRTTVIVQSIKHNLKKISGTASSQGMLAATTSWKRQGTDSPLERPEGAAS